MRTKPVKACLTGDLIVLSTLEISQRWWEESYELGFLPTTVAGGGRRRDSSLRRWQRG